MSRLKEIINADYDALENFERFNSDYSWLIEQAEKAERYEEALKYIAGENGNVFADTLEEARKSALTALEEERE
jgi:hypothetical protein